MKKDFIAISIALLIFLLNFNNIGLAQDKKSNKTEPSILKTQISKDEYIYTKKDPHLITIPTTEFDIEDKLYNTKFQNDSKQIKTQSKGYTEEQAYLYEMLDRLVRANNLQYQNWRIGMITVKPEDIGAHSATTNYIGINNSLYDSLYQDKDAMAFVVGHELSHIILGHTKVAAENRFLIQQYQREINNLRYKEMLSRFDQYGGLEGASCKVSIMAYQKKINKIYQELRQFEIDADTESLTLLTKAGYDPEKAINALVYISNLPDYTNRYDSEHPSHEIRLKNIKKELELAHVEELNKDGKKNLYNSNPLDIKKSSDKETIILSLDSNYKKTEYPKTDKETRLLRRGYRYYLQNNNDKAIEYFKDAHLKNPKNYISPLYLSYAYTNKYNTSKNIEDLKEAGTWIKKSNKLKKDDNNIEEQKHTVKKLFIDYKNGKKSQD